MTAKYEESKIQLLPHTIDEKWAIEQDDLVNSTGASPAKCCHSNGHRRNAFVKGGLIGLVGLLITLLSFLVMAILCPGVHSLLKRQNTTDNNGNTGSAFTNEHLWIIIVCVVGIGQFLLD
jgi:hypothetical protein